MKVIVLSFLKSRIASTKTLKSILLSLHILFFACDVNNGPLGIKSITSFEINGALGAISEQTIIVTVPYGTDVTALAPVVTFTGNSLAPASETAQDFTNPVTYRVTAADGSVRDYTVTVQRRGAKGIEITFDPLPYEPVDLSVDSANDLSRAQQDTLRITVTGATARWFVDGREQSETGSVLTIAAIDFPVGTHHVAALIYKDEIPYSGEATFKVIK